MDNRQKNDYKVLFESLQDRYCRLLFITGLQDARSAFLHQIPDHGAPIQVSLELVKILHTLPASQQTKAVTDFFVRLGEDSSAVFLSELEILFDRALSIDPVKLLKTTARNRAMVVEWPGKFKVIWVEIGSVNTSFREIIVHELEEFLASEGISFSIPTADSITNNKGWLEDMMAAFNTKYPDYVLLFVVDELLDYLHGKNLSKTRIVLV